MENQFLAEEAITNKIYLLRGQKVMLDMDLANLYTVETRTLKQSVRRNIKRFPEDFIFELTAVEWQQLITNSDKLAGKAKFSPSLPFAFTERYAFFILTAIA